MLGPPSVNVGGVWELVYTAILNYLLAMAV